MNLCYQERTDQLRYLDRELTWLQFNHRVQKEAENLQNPLLERAKFLGIVTSNLDEFMQVRYVSILRDGQGENRDTMLSSGLTLQKKLELVDRAVTQQQKMQYVIYHGMVEEMAEQDICFYPKLRFTDAMQSEIKRIFWNDVMPKLKIIPWGEEYWPMNQKKLRLMVKLQPKNGNAVRYAMVSYPGTPRLFKLPCEDGSICLIRHEDLLRHWLWMMFSQDDILEASAFRIIRNQEFPLNPEEDVATAVREMLVKRTTGDVMRLEAEENISDEALQILAQRFSVPDDQLFRVAGPLDLSKLMMTCYGMIRRPDLKYPKDQQVIVHELMDSRIFKRIGERDWLLFHPYHSFEPIVNLFSQAAADSDVISIKTTLYRVGNNSQVVRALVKAAEAGKQVEVIMETQARFDEDANLSNTEKLRRAGCRVICGIPGLKTHSKAILITRRENSGLRQYVHLGTGNYHDGNAKIYTDMGLLTSDGQICSDVLSFFSALEHESRDLHTEALIAAPTNLKTKVFELIEREKQHALVGRPGGIVAKMNSLLDEQVTDALYDASCAGVKIRLIVRGICTLIPGDERLSRNIQVTSIIGRHLEHARAFIFENGGDKEVYLSSADWMPRNLDRRYELMFLIRDERCRQAIENVLMLQLMDNLKGWRMHPNGDYTRKQPDGKLPVNAQEVLIHSINEVFSGRWEGFHQN
ncbi:MAG: polyphosphate kinase 1 [Clostridiales bacterium]|nr:polyphosphate kinase 1 [Clostridiales bacterium]